MSHWRDQDSGVPIEANWVTLDPKKLSLGGGEMGEEIARQIQCTIRSHPGLTAPVQGTDGSYR